ncbi:MAG: nicotinate (nicotinamide) nucleotide adenylyltransferase [Gemmatimonas sp.]|nr:nicotinate (nicotinamide) nucleotide adenylyltransferase [Gemmatimonas sp.]
MAARRLGVFGGTFDPPHHGHLIAATGAHEALRLDRLILVPAADPPHKQGRVGATAEQRLSMIRAAVAGDPRLEVDDRELRRQGPSYTVDTLRELRANLPEDEIFFLLGSDQFAALDHWHEPQEVVRLATLGVFARGEETSPLDGPYPGMHVPIRRIDISGTEIRRRCAAGLSIRYYVPEAVREIIEGERIY